MSTPHPVNYCAVTTVAKYFNLTARRVQQLAREGIIPKPENGQYHLLKCFVGFIQYLQSKETGKQSDSADERKERTRLLAAQASKAELDLKKEHMELIPTNHAIADWSNMVLTFRAKMLALPYRVATLIMGVKEHHEVEKILKDLIYEALTELSQYGPRTCRASESNEVMSDVTTVNQDNNNLEVS